MPISQLITLRRVPIDGKFMYRNRLENEMGDEALFEDKTCPWRVAAKAIAVIVFFMIVGSAWL